VPLRGGTHPTEFLAPTISSCKHSVNGPSGHIDVDHCLRGNYSETRRLGPIPLPGLLNHNRARGEPREPRTGLAVHARTGHRATGGFALPVLRPSSSWHIFTYPPVRWYSAGVPPHRAIVPRQTNDRHRRNVSMRHCARPARLTAPEMRRSSPVPHRSASPGPIEVRPSRGAANLRPRVASVISHSVFTEVGT
jgi:hypothetical protein